MFSWTPAIFASYPVYTTDAQFIKDQGGTRVAAVGYGISPSSSATAKGMGPAAKAVGIDGALHRQFAAVRHGQRDGDGAGDEVRERRQPLRPDRSQHVAGAPHRGQADRSEPEGDRHVDRLRRGLPR